MANKLFRRKYILFCRAGIVFLPARFIKGINDQSTFDLDRIFFILPEKYASSPESVGEFRFG